VGEDVGELEIKDGNDVELLDIGAVDTERCLSLDGPLTPGKRQESPATSIRLCLSDVWGETVS
jgi:hypothetical protein